MSPYLCLNLKTQIHIVSAANKSRKTFANYIKSPVFSDSNNSIHYHNNALHHSVILISTPHGQLSQQFNDGRQVALFGVEQLAILSGVGQLTVMSDGKRSIILFGIRQLTVMSDGEQSTILFGVGQLAARS